MVWKDLRQGQSRQRCRPMIQAVILVFLLSAITCAEMVVYDAISSRIRPCKVYAYTLVLWIVPLVGAAAVCWFLQTFPVRGILVAYILAQLAVVLHEVVVLYIWSVASVNIQLFVRFALIQSVLKLFTMSIASLNLRSRAPISTICCMTGIFYATMYSVLPILLSPFYTMTWGFIADTALFQTLNAFLGLITSFFIIVFGRPVGSVVGLVFDAPLIGTFAWLSYLTAHLTIMYRSLMILGTMLIALGLYLVVVRRKSRLCDAHMPLETRGSVLIIS